MSSTEGVIADKVVADWAPGERESFFRAIQRHRRAAWRVSIVSSIANCTVAFIVAVLMAPIFYAVICLAFDLANLAVPTPNLVTAIVTAYRAAEHHPGQVEWFRPLVFILATATPGLIWMAAIIRMLSRVLTVAAGGSKQLHTRSPNPGVLAEQRFVNVVEEMSIAAGLPAPSVLVTQRDMLNAAIRGNSEQSASIIVSEPLLATLTRQEMQGVVANLVASIADGDLAIGHRIALTIGLFGVTARFSSVLNADEGFRQTWRLLRALRDPSAESAQLLVREIAEPYEGGSRFRKSRSTRAAPTSDAKKESNWRVWLWLPLAGPVVMSGFFTGLVSLFILRPLLAATWRQRKYMADAIAVRLTRDPDALASALGRMGAGQAFSPWMAHLSVVSAQKRGELLGGSIVPMFPSSERRLRALRKMGANVALAKRKPLDWRVFVILPPLATLFVVLLSIVIVLCGYVSIPMSALFTGVPFAILHLLLRAIGH
jgi:Zn-dependent protease with chaperone function